MYVVIGILEDEATRFVKLKNIDTGIVEECFDDSAVVSNINFNFILIGKQYECKINLFGKPVDEKTNNSVICTIINKNIIIAKKPMVEVQVNGNKYYIARQKVKEYIGRDSFSFVFARKDLIQVNSIIHADLL